MANTVKFGIANNPDVATKTGVGTAQDSGPTLVRGINVLVTDTGATAVTLPSLQQAPVVCRNSTSETAVIFPPVGGAINGGSANAKVDLATTKVGVFSPHPNGLDYTFQLGA